MDGNDRYDELPRRDAVVILSVTALLVALIVLFFAHTPSSARRPGELPSGSSASPSSEMEREPLDRRPEGLPATVDRRPEGLPATVDRRPEGLPSTPTLSLTGE